MDWKEQRQTITKKMIASIVFQREDNIYKMSVIQEIFNMCLEEMELALENGEKVSIGEIGSLSPSVHTPRTYNIGEMNHEDGNTPYTTIKFGRKKGNKQRMNNKYLQNIEDGKYGLGYGCMCTPQQIAILEDKGYIKEND